MVPMLALVGLRWATIAAATVQPGRAGRRAAVGARGAVVVARDRPGWCCSARPGGSGSRPAAPGCCCAACGRAATRAAARCTCGCGRRPGSPSCPARPASPARRGRPATPARSARRSARTSTCTPLRPVTGLLKIGRGAAVEPEVDLGGYWVDGDVVHIGKIRIGAGPGRRAQHAAARARGSARAPRSPPGSTVRGAVPAGQRWAGSPARADRQERRDLAGDPAAALAVLGGSPTASRRRCSGCSRRWPRCRRS